MSFQTHIRLKFIFETQMKIFLMKSKIFLSLSWKLHNYHLPNCELSSLVHISEET